MQSKSLAGATAPAPKEAGARLAVTRYRVRERRATVTVLDVMLGTGRRHQIRVQLAALGHPVVGDRAYHAKTDPVPPPLPARDHARLRAPGHRRRRPLREPAPRRAFAPRRAPPVRPGVTAGDRSGASIVR